MNSAEVQTRRVDRIVINSQYNRQTKEADIAMMHLEQPVNFTRQSRTVCSLLGLNKVFLTERSGVCYRVHPACVFTP